MNNIGGHLQAIERNIELNTKDPILREGFTQVLSRSPTMNGPKKSGRPVPNHILRDPEISVGAKIVYSMFLSYPWNNDYCFPGQERLAVDCGSSERSVRTWQKVLEEKELVEVKRRELGKTNLYTLHFTVKKKCG